MPTKVRYTGNVSPYFPPASTGVLEAWRPGMLAEVADNQVAALVALGVFQVDDTAPESPGATRPYAAWSTDASGNAVGLVGPGGAVESLARSPSLLKRGFPLLRAPASATGYTAESADVTVSRVVRRGRACLELTFNPTASTMGVNFDIPSRTYSPNISWTFEIEDASEWNGGNMRIGLWTAGTFVDGMQHSFTVGTASGYDGIHSLTPMNSTTSEWTAQGSGSFASTMTKCRMRFVRKASPTGTTRVWVYEIAESEGQSLPGIYVGADDGHMTWYSDGLPLCEKYGFSSYLAYIADDQNGTTRMRDAVEWADAISRGHHAVVHGPKSGRSTLRDYFASFDPYPNAAAAIVADIEYNRDRMIAAGLDPGGRGRRIYVYPGGFHQPSGGAGDDTIINAARACGMQMGRIAVVQNGINVNGGGRGMSMYLPIIGHSYAGGSEATNITNLVARMQAEIAAGRPVIFMFHEVRTSPTLAEQITSANLETILAAAQALVQNGTARAGRLTDLVTEFAQYTEPVHLGA